MAYIDFPAGNKGVKERKAFWLSEDGIELISSWRREGITQEEIASKRCASMVGSTQKVLIEGAKGKDGILNARTSGNVIVEIKAPEELIGTFQNVEITSAGNWILKGKVI